LRKAGDYVWIIKKREGLPVCHLRREGRLLKVEAVQHGFEAQHINGIVKKLQRLVE
jgi:hypothetical protein